MSSSSVFGISAVEVVGALLKLHPDISELTVFEPAPVPLAQERLSLDDRSRHIIETALDIRTRFGFPFWDAALISTYGQPEASVPIIEKALFHNRSVRRTLRIQSGQWSSGFLDSIMKDTPPGHALVLRSKVKLDCGTFGHIPFVDFHCPATAENQDLSARASGFLDPKGGYLLESGQSYHFYGKSLLPEKGLYPFLGRALLLSPVVDRAWVAHQLIEGTCGLRISPKMPGGQMPYVVAEPCGIEH